MGAEPRKDMRTLIAKSKVLADLASSLKEHLRRVEAYLFSSKVRPILFSAAEETKREEAVEDIERYMADLSAKACTIESLTERFLQIVKRNKPFTVRRHQKDAVSYLYSALHEEKRVIKTLRRLKKQFQRLRKNHGDRETQKIFRSIKAEFKKLQDILDETHIRVSDFQGRAQVQATIQMKYDQINAKNILNPTNVHRIDKMLKRGDILLSFKSPSFLKNFRTSKWIARVTGSQITHVAVYMGKGKLVHTADYANRPVLADVKIAEVAREMHIIVRPHLNDHQRTELIRAIRIQVKERKSYSSWKAAAIAPAIIADKIINTFFRRKIHVQNPLSRMVQSSFCSEFVDQVFRSVGCYLTPKSRHHGSAVSPADIAASPYITYVGICFLPEKVNEILMDELMAGATI
ncbi:MAG: hypothetical protein ACE5DM_00090 [Candidatus Nanoarchaeia archaeon]